MSIKLIETKNQNSFLKFLSYLSLFMAAPLYIFPFSFLDNQKFALTDLANGITIFMLASFLPFLISGIIYLKCVNTPNIEKYSPYITCMLFPVLVLIWFYKGIPFLHSEAMFGPADGHFAWIYKVGIFFGLILYIGVSLIFLLVFFWLIRHYSNINYHYFTLPCLLICSISMCISFFNAYQSLNGYCEQDARYMNENEKLHIALDALILQASQNQLETYSPDWRNNQPSAILTGILRNYGSSKQFLNAHSNCCELHRAQTFLWGKQFGESFTYGDPLWIRLKGQLDTWLTIRTTQSSDSIILDNCGRPARHKYKGF